MYGNPQSGRVLPVDALAEPLGVFAVLLLPPTPPLGAPPRDEAMERPLERAAHRLFIGAGRGG